MEVRLKRIGMRNFRSFVGQHDLVLPQSGMMLLEGPSGVGKSNLLRAIALGLDIESIPGTKLRTWLNEEPWGIELEMSVDGRRVVRRVGSRNSLEIEGEETLTAAGAIQDRMTIIRGKLEPGVLRAMTYRPQRGAGVFLSQPDGRKRSFLVKVIPQLARFEDEEKEAATLLNKLTQEVEVLTASAAAYREGLGLEPTAPPVHDLMEQKLLLETSVASRQFKMEALRRQLTEQEWLEQAQRTAVEEQYAKSLAAADAKLYQHDQTLFCPGSNTEVQKLKLGLEECKRRLAAARRAHEVEKHNTVKCLQERMATSRSNRQSIDRLNIKLSDTRQELLQLLDAKCPRCERQWAEAQKNAELAKQHIKSIEHEIQVLEQQVEDVSMLEQALSAAHAVSPSSNVLELEFTQQSMQDIILTEELKQETASTLWRSQHTAERAELEKEKLKLMAQQNEQLTKQPRPSLETKQLLDAANQTLLEARQQQQVVDTKIQHAQQLEAQYQVALQRWQAAQQNVAAAEQKLQSHKAQLCVWQDYQEVIRGFLRAAFEELLLEVQHETNATLAQVPNTQDVTIRFETSKVKQDGDVASCIQPIITVRGYETDVVTGLSGGMGTMVDLAVDQLALGDVAARRSGFRACWLMLDEAFDGMGAADRESCLDMLAQKSQDRLIVVVTHAADFKDRFSKRVRVGIKPDGSSYMEEA